MVHERPNTPSTRRKSAQATRPGRRGILARLVIGAAMLAVGGVLIALRDGGGSDTGVTFTINAPTDGASVTSPVTLDLALRGARLGSPTEGRDHLHLSLDGGPPIAEYTSTRLPLQIPSGHHTLTIELAGPDHTPLLPERTVTFTVSG